MNIAFFTSHIHKSLQWEWLSKGLKDSGEFDIFIHIIFYDSNMKEPPFLIFDLEKNNIKVYPIELTTKWSYILAIIKCLKILKENKINIVHTSLPHGNLFGLLSAFFSGIKLRVNTCENSSWAFDHKSIKQKIIDKIAFSLSLKTIAGSENSKEFLLNKWKLKEKNLETIYHGLEEKDYENISEDRIKSLKSSLKIGENEFVIGMISRLELWKGHDFAIHAMAKLKEKHPNIKLYIFGSSGKDKETILSLIKLLDLEDTVFYKGFIADSVTLFKLFDIHLHIPINKYVENCGISIIEGMISKKAQILTKSGYAFQSAVHLKNCYVVDYCNSEQVALGIETLYQDESLRNALAESAHLTAISEYSNKVKVDKHIKLYKSLFENR